MKKLGKKYKWEVLALLWFAFLNSQADRQALNVVLPLIKADLSLTDIQLGIIASSFNIVFALTVPFAGYFGDLYSKKKIVVFSFIFWSIGTMLTGLGNGMLILILMRSVTSFGEASFAPANYTLLARYHTKNTRAFAMSLHQTAYYVGIILSGYIAGYIGETWGWRWVFYIFGAVGVIHGVVMFFRLKDDTVKEKESQEGKISFNAALKILFKTPTAILLIIAFCGLIFVQVGYLTWTPTYLYEKFNMTLSQAGFHSMFYTHLFAFAGIIFVGKYSDKLAVKNPRIRLLMQGAGLLFAVPFIILMGNSNVLFIIYIGFAGFGFARAFFDANTYTVLYDVIPEKFQSTVSGIMIMAGFLIGSLSPIIMGYLKPILGLSFGISMLSVVWLLCGVLLLIAYKYYFKKDYAKVHQLKINDYE
jgi:MFS transporter, Spinster family, sphingosine-1-phosphate transporter